MTETSHAKHPLVVWQSVVAGSVAGAVEVLVNYPLWTIKNRLQLNMPSSFRPSVLYLRCFIMVCY